MTAGSWTSPKWGDLPSTTTAHSRPLLWARRRVSLRSLRRWLATLTLSAGVAVYLMYAEPASVASEDSHAEPRPGASWLDTWRRSETSDGRWLASPTVGLPPRFETDPAGNRLPPEVYPALMNPYRRANATFFAVVRERDLGDLLMSMRTVEDRVNRKFGYPWVFLSDQPFSPDSALAIKSMTRSQVFFGLIPARQWAYPPHVDRRRAARAQKPGAAGSKKGADDQSRRHLSRFHAGFFFRHPLMAQFDYYWRVGPGIQYTCDVDYDPFVFMEENKKVFSFSISLMEYQSTIPSLWKTVQGFVRANPGLLAANSSLDFLVKDPSRGIESDYNLCQFWSNLEIVDMRFWRSATYANFFGHLDRAGGIYYERWAEGPIHSIAAALFLPRAQIHRWDDLGYFQPPFSHCPPDYDRFHANGKCFCDPLENFDLGQPYSCDPLWAQLPARKESIDSHT